MAMSPLPQAPVTEYSGENKCTYLDTGPSFNQEGDGKGKPKARATKLHSKTSRAKLYSNDSTSDV